MSDAHENPPIYLHSCKSRGLWKALTGTWRGCSLQPPSTTPAAFLCICNPAPCFRPQSVRTCPNRPHPRTSSVPSALDSMTPRLGDWANRRSKSRAKAAAKAIATEEIATEEIATEPPVPLPSKLLVANRGEIAVRLCKSAKSLGVATVAIYTAADIGSMHVKAADEHYEVNSYIDEEAIVGIAVSTACTAVIPGYGFISESKSFAEACERKGIEFCGPGPEVLSTFGLKHTARAAAQKAGVPICLGTDVLETGAAALKWARETNVQYPLLFKAIAGGGGIGMVQVDEESEVEAAFDVASRNAKKAFGDGRMYVEQMLVGARHIEVQIFGDGKGDAVALGTRECSVQRRNQKVVEETPAPNIPADRLD